MNEILPFPKSFLILHRVQLGKGGIQSRRVLWMGGIILQTLPLSSTNLSRQTVLCQKKKNFNYATSLHDQKREGGSNYSA